MDATSAPGAGHINTAKLRPFLITRSAYKPGAALDDQSPARLTHRDRIRPPDHHDRANDCVNDRVNDCVNDRVDHVPAAARGPAAREMRPAR